jgi:hypothetical protein
VGFVVEVEEHAVIPSVRGGNGTPDDTIKTIVLLAGTSRVLEKRVDDALRDIPPDRIVAISYAVSRIFGVTLQHHALIVLTRSS